MLVLSSLTLLKNLVSLSSARFHQPPAVLWSCSLNLPRHLLTRRAPAKRTLLVQPLVSVLLPVTGLSLVRHYLTQLNRMPCLRIVSLAPLKAALPARIATACNVVVAVLHHFLWHAAAPTAVPMVMAHRHRRYDDTM